MKLFLQLILFLLLSTSFLEAAPARGGVLTFTQSDGTKFEGLLKGDSSFHWVESHGKVVMYNSKDKLYYNASFDEVGQLVISKDRPKAKNEIPKTSRSFRIAEQKSVTLHAVSNSDMNALLKMQKNAKRGNHPR